MKGVGMVPGSPQPGVVRDLLVSRVAKDSREKFAELIAPRMQLTAEEGHSGTYTVDTGYYGLDLSRDPKALQPVSLSSTSYLDEDLDYDSRPFECRRWPVGRCAMPDRKVQRLRAAAGIEAELAIVTKFEAKYAAMRYQLVLNRLNDANSYAPGHTYDPGNLTDPDYDLGGQMEVVLGKFADAQVDLANADLVFAADPLLVTSLRKNKQVMAWAGGPAPSPNTNYETDAGVGRWLKDILGCRSLELVVDRPRHRDPDGVSVTGLTAGSAVLLLRGEGRSRSFLKSLTTPEEEGEVSIRSRYDSDMPGSWWVCDFYADVANLVDPTAAVRWEGALA